MKEGGKVRVVKRRVGLKIIRSPSSFMYKLKNSELSFCISVEGQAVSFGKISDYVLFGKISGAHGKFRVLTLYIGYGT